MTYRFQIKDTKKARPLIDYLRTLKYVRFIDEEKKVKEVKGKKKNRGKN